MRSERATTISVYNVCMDDKKVRLTEQVKAAG
jgi:hypothetical protein